MWNTAEVTTKNASQHKPTLNPPTNISMPIESCWESKRSNGSKNLLLFLCLFAPLVSPKNPYIDGLVLLLVMSTQLVNTGTELAQPTPQSLLKPHKTPTTGSSVKSAWKECNQLAWFPALAESVLLDSSNVLHACVQPVPPGLHSLVMLRLQLWDNLVQLPLWKS